MKTLLKLVGPLLFGAVMVAACARKNPPPPATDGARAPSLATAPAPAPWEPVDKQFTGCAGS